MHSFKTQQFHTLSESSYILETRFSVVISGPNFKKVMNFCIKDDYFIIFFLLQLFENTIKQSQLSLLQDWVVFSLSNFTQSLSVGMATWYLTCFFISASTNEWLRAYFPYVQSRIGRYEYDDRKMLCIAGVDFYKNLPTDKQKQTFVENFQAVRDQGDILFGDLLESL